MTNNTTHSFEYKILSNDELSSSDRLLIEHAKKACKTAFSPYSKFIVGAAILLDNDQIVLGSNQENAAYPSGLCAERVALFNAAVNHNDTLIKKIAVVGRKQDTTEFTDVSPCGSCRQVMLEYEEKQEEDIEVLFLTAQGWIRIPKSSMLLPFCFDKNSLT
jgi:cytidine deaminase